MIRRLPVLLLCMCLLNACGDSAGDRLPPAKMEALLMDIHLAEAWNSVSMRDSIGQQLPRNYDSLATYYNGIYRHYGITAEDFKRSMDWYRAHPAELDSIYSHLNEKLSELEARNMGK